MVYERLLCKRCGEPMFTEQNSIAAVVLPDSKEMDLSKSSIRFVDAWACHNCGRRAFTGFAFHALEIDESEIASKIFDLQASGYHIAIVRPPAGGDFEKYVFWPSDPNPKEKEKKNV